MNITNEMINEIRNKVDIVDVISNYNISMTQRGKNYFCVCPFHDDHSPSMSISQEKQIYTCFSCGETGNVFTFVSNYQHIGFYDAVRVLGNKVGYNLGNEKLITNKNSESYEIYDLACRFYQNNLNTSLGRNAQNYLEQRQIDKESIKKFKIGLSVSKTSLTDYLLSKKVSLNKLIELGISNENGTDLFINRIMFPLYDLEGNIVAFSGRIYNIRDSSKYINTKETSIFKKGSILYNYHNAKEMLKKNKSIIVMEGFMDVIRANTIGIVNCVATMGTALTKQNALLLKKMSESIVLCFDGDKAGEEATTSAISIFKEIDVVPKVVRLEENLDPDEYILKYGREKFKSKIDNPENSIEFLMTLHRNDKNLTDIEDISKYIDESIKDLISVNDTVLIELTLKKISTEFNVEYKIIKDKYETLKSKNVIKKIDLKSKKEKKYNQYDISSRLLIYYMLKDEKVINLVEKKVTFFPDTNIRILANEMILYYHKYGVLNIADFISYISNREEITKLFKEIMTMEIKEKYIPEEIDDYIKVINSYPVKKKITDLNKKLREESDPIKQANILSEILSIKGVEL